MWCYFLFHFPPNNIRFYRSLSTRTHTSQHTHTYWHLLVALVERFISRFPSVGNSAIYFFWWRDNQRTNIRRFLNTAEEGWSFHFCEIRKATFREGLESSSPLWTWFRVGGIVSIKCKRGLVNVDRNCVTHVSVRGGAVSRKFRSDISVSRNDWFVRFYMAPTVLTPCSIDEYDRSDNFITWCRRISPALNCGENTLVCEKGVIHRIHYCTGVSQPPTIRTKQTGKWRPTALGNHTPMSLSIVIYFCDHVASYEIASWILSRM